MHKIEPKELIIRAAALEDSETIAVLSGQLGYPATEHEIRQRLEALQEADKEIVLVAEVAGSGVMGWAHACLVRHLMHPAYAELTGLVVAEGQRSAGIGAALLSHIENWSQNLGCDEVWVRSNVLRERAHRFYIRSGYRKKKSQHVFFKTLHQNNFEIITQKRKAD